MARLAAAREPKWQRTLPRIKRGFYHKTKLSNDRFWYPTSLSEAWVYSRTSFLDDLKADQNRQATE